MIRYSIKCTACGIIDDQAPPVKGWFERLVTTESVSFVLIVCKDCANEDDYPYDGKDLLS